MKTTFFNVGEDELIWAVGMGLYSILVWFFILYLQPNMLHEFLYLFKDFVEAIYLKKIELL